MTDSIARDDWDLVCRRFEEFFGRFGEVSADAQCASFAAPRAGTGLELRADGTSASFMPLHGLELRWDSVRFDDAQLEVTLSAAGGTYTYRVPPGLTGK
jgi:hypothetical protein